jgi:hypothetical protein
MITTTQFKVQEDNWANRYIEKVFQDLYGIASSADLELVLHTRLTMF